MSEKKYEENHHDFDFIHTRKSFISCVHTRTVDLRNKYSYDAPAHFIEDTF